jgi:hypothetical protein
MATGAGLPGHRNRVRGRQPLAGDAGAMAGSARRPGRVAGNLRFGQRALLLRVRVRAGVSAGAEIRSAVAIDPPGSTPARADRRRRAAAVRHCDGRSDAVSRRPRGHEFMGLAVWPDEPRAVSGRQRIFLPPPPQTRTRPPASTRRPPAVLVLFDPLLDRARCAPDALHRADAAPPRRRRRGARAHPGGRHQHERRHAPLRRPRLHR